MLPFRLKDAGPEPAGSPPEDNKLDNPSATKPSLRVFDGIPMSREDDLTNGPYLRGLGTNLSDSAAEFQLHIDAHETGAHSNSRAALDSTVASGLNKRPFSISKLPSTASHTETATASNLSSGPSYSVPNDDQTAASGSQFVSLDESTLPLHHGATSRIGALFPVKIEVDDFDMSLSAPDTDNDSQKQPLFPWKFGFAWDNGHLTFVGDRLVIKRPTASSGANSTRGQSKPPETSDCQTVISATATTAYDELESKILSGTLQEKIFWSGVLSEALDNTTDELAKTLEYHYYETCGPYQAAPYRGDGHDNDTTRNAAKSNASRTSSGRVSKIQSRSKGKAPESRKVHHDSDSATDDEEEEDDGRPVSAKTNRERNLRPLSCPFQRQYPFEWFCTSRMYYISKLISHLESVHYPLQCSFCSRMFSNKFRLDAHMEHKCIPPPYESQKFITKAKMSAIEDQLKGLVTREEKWCRIFSILFPGSEIPSPYFEVLVDQLRDRFENFFRDKGRSIVLHDYQRLRREGGIVHPDSETQLELVFERCMISMMRRYWEHEKRQFQSPDQCGASDPLGTALGSVQPREPPETMAHWPNSGLEPHVATESEGLALSIPGQLTQDNMEMWTHNPDTVGTGPLVHGDFSNTGYIEDLWLPEYVKEGLPWTQNYSGSQSQYPCQSTAGTSSMWIGEEWPLPLLNSDSLPMAQNAYDVNLGCFMTPLVQNTASVMDNSGFAGVAIPELVYNPYIAEPTCAFPQMLPPGDQTFPSYITEDSERQRSTANFAPMSVSSWSN